MREFHRGLALIATHADLVGVDKLANALNHLHLTLLGKARQPLGELFDHLLLTGAHLVQVDLRFAEADPHMRDLGGLVNDVRGMQQRL